MSKPFDASPKSLLQFGPADWPAFLGVKARLVEIVDADVSTVTASTDKVLVLHDDEGDRIQHFDFQSGPDATVPRRMHTYNALLENRHDLPVESVVVLLTRRANLLSINGVYGRNLPGERKSYLRFHFRVIRVWQLPVESVLSAGPSVLPLAPISDVPKGQLSSVIERMERRFATLADRSMVGDLWTAAKVLMGLKYDKVLTDQLLRGVRAMKESVTYQAIVEEGKAKGRVEGRVEEALQILLRIGGDQFSEPPKPEQLHQLKAITEVGHLEELAVRVLHVRNWSELLASPESPRPRRRKKS